MNKNKFRFLIIIFFLLFLSGCQKVNKPSNIIRVGDKELQVEYAITEPEQIQGLAGRDNLCFNCGMFFVFSNYQIREFWMRDMKFALDIIWLKDQQVVGFSQKVPIYTLTGEITRLSSPVEVNRVIEVNSGWCERNNIQIGDQLTGHT